MHNSVATQAMSDSLRSLDEIRYALDCARQVPLDQIFIVPVRLDDCEPPRVISHELQYIDLFPDRRVGLARLISMMRREFTRRREGST